MYKQTLGFTAAMWAGGIQRSRKHTVEAGPMFSPLMAFLSATVSQKPGLCRCNPADHLKFS